MFFCSIGELYGLIVHWNYGLLVVVDKDFSDSDNNKDAKFKVVAFFGLFCC